MEKRRYMRGKTIEEKLIANHVKNKETDCWEWIAAKHSFGYGNMMEGRAHRLAYQTWIGEIPRNMCVCHHCDNPSCINPDHLFLGAHKDNLRDMHNKKRWKITNRKGEDYSVSKLNDKKVKEIKKLLLRGEFQHAIAEKFGVAQSTIKCINKEQTWKHVSWPKVRRDRRKIKIKKVI